jgi:hypothetical protein
MRDARAPSPAIDGVRGKRQSAGGRNGGVKSELGIVTSCCDQYTPATLAVTSSRVTGRPIALLPVVPQSSSEQQSSSHDPQFEGSSVADAT